MQKGYPTAPMRLLTGHWVRPTLKCTGYYLVEVEPAAGVFMFSHDNRVPAIIAEHNRLWIKKHGGGEN